jgi:hypothetical protein
VQDLANGMVVHALMLVLLLVMKRLVPRELMLLKIIKASLLAIGMVQSAPISYRLTVVSKKQLLIAIIFGLATSNIQVAPLKIASVQAAIALALVPGKAGVVLIN